MLGMKKRNFTGGNIRKIRTEAGLTQEELALKSGLSQGYINQLENGKRKFTQKSLELISKALAVPIIEFFRGAETFPMPVVKEEEAEYGKKRPQAKDIAALLKRLPPHIVEHYIALLKMEVELNKKRKQ